MELFKSNFIYSPIIHIIFIVLFTPCLIAQNNQNYIELYPNDDVVTTSLSKHINILDKKGKLTITEEVRKTNYFITDNRLSLANESVSHNTFNSIKSINAHTFNQSENSNENNIVRRFTDKDVLINGIFFNDQKKKSFIYPKVKKGAFTHLQYIKNINDPHFLPAFIIGNNTPIHKGQFSISFPHNVEINYKTFNLDTLNTTFEKTIDDEKIVYKWTLKSIPKINRHYDLSPLYYVPQIIIYIKSYTSKGEKTNILSTPKDLYKWYLSLISGINKTNGQDLKLLTENLVKDATTIEEKIKRIYYFIQGNINYIAFEDGLNGFIPRDAINVYSKKYGDCKDMANILNEMLHYANIPSYLTWIGTRKKPYSYHDVPTPIADNHMITTIKIGNNYVFLDATAKYLTYGLPSPFIQGKEALIGIDKNNFNIVKVPEVEAKKNKISITSVFSIEESSLALEGTHQTELSGYEKLGFLHKLEKKDDVDLSFLYTNLKFGTKKTLFEAIDYKNLSIEKPLLQITFNSYTKGYIRKFDNKLYIKPNLDFNLNSELVKNEAKAFDKEIKYKCEKHFSTTLLIPNGYTLENLPNNSSYKNDFFGFTINYELSEDASQIQINKQVRINTLKITPENIDNWNGFVKYLNKSNKHNIILKKI